MGVGGHLMGKADCERMMHDVQECKAKEKKITQGQQAGVAVGAETGQL